MKQIANDSPLASAGSAPAGAARDGLAQAGPAVGGGILLAIISATTFGLSGPLASGLLTAGWSPGAIVLCRMTIAAVALAPFTVAALRGRWRLLRRQAWQILVYGVLAVAGAQFC